MKCPKCGKEIANDSAFCEFCGAKTKRRNMQVDIRWALLPAMLLATLAILRTWSIMNYSPVYRTNGVVFAMIPPAMVFLITMWNGVKKKVALSFVLIIGILFFSCSGMFLDIVNHDGYLQYSTEIYYNDVDKNYKSVKLVTDGNETAAGVHNTSELNEAEQQLKQLRSYILNKLEQDGATNIDGDYGILGSPYYGGGVTWVGIFLLPLTCIFLLLYFVYAFLAHKKGWTF